MATASSQERTRSRRRSTAAARSRARANGRPADAARRARDTAQQGANGVAEGATGTLQQVTDKVKGPALAGGAAALAAIAAGGVALARNGKRGKGRSLPSIGRKRSGIHMPQVSMPHLPHRSHDGETTDALRAAAKALGTAAVEVGKAGYKASELATEVRRAREQVARGDD